MEEGPQKKKLNYHEESSGETEKQMTLRHCRTEEEKSARICSLLQIHVIGSTAASPPASPTPSFFPPILRPFEMEKWVICVEVNILSTYSAALF